MDNHYSRSPPPLQHPVPTHPAYIPDPPSTPASPQGYQRFTSSPGPPLLNVQPQYSQSVPAYMSSFHHQPHTQHPHPPLQHSQHPNIPLPDYAAWGMSDVTAQFGMQLGQNAVAAGQDYVQRNVRSCFALLLSGRLLNMENCVVVWCHTFCPPQASLQRVKFIRHPKITSSSLSLVA
jgi:hypothetical protein